MNEWISYFISPTVFAGVIGSLVAIFVKIKMDKNEKRLQIFTRYSEKYSTLMGVIAKEGDFSREFSPKSERDREYSLKLFFLFSEEYYLQDAGLIEPSVWSIWKEGILKTMELVYFQGAWKFCQTQADFSGEFEKMMNSKSLPEIDHKTQPKQAA